MIVFALSSALGSPPQPAAAISVAQRMENRVVCGGDIIVKLLTFGGNHTTAYC